MWVKSDSEDNIEIYLTLADKYDIPSLKHDIRVTQTYFEGVNRLQ